MTASPHADRKHSKYSASNAHRWLVCHGQPDLVEKLKPPRRESPYAEAGTLAHEILEKCLRTGQRAGAVCAVDEIINSVDLVLDYVRVLCNQHPDMQINAEEWYPFPQDVVPARECGGTLDVKLYSPAARRVWLIDFKHGAGVAVEVIDNPQLKSYAAATVMNLSVGRITLVIVQPRAEHIEGPIREWDLHVSDLLDFIAEVDEVLRGPKDLTPGGHCHWCEARAGCPAAEKTALAVFDGVTFVPPDARDFFGEGLPDPKSLDIAKWTEILRRADVFKDWLKAGEELVFAHAAGGGYTPGFKIVEAQARRRWDGEPDAIAARLSELSGFMVAASEFNAPRLIGITDAEAKVLAAVRAAHDTPSAKTEAAAAARAGMAYLTTKASSGNLTLVPDSDHRPSTNRAAKAFAGVDFAMPEPAALPAPPKPVTNYLEGMRSYADER